MSMICALKGASGGEIETLLARPEKILAFLRAKTDLVDLDKAWHGIHFLLTGSAWEGPEPLCYLVRGGREIGDIDVGYGPARALNPAEVHSFNDALSRFSREYLARRFDSAAMMQAEIYPTIWDRNPQDDDALGYLLEYFDVLKGFVARCGYEGKGIVTYLA